ncbi:pyridoxal 5'-phosphate synthase glutaminase subunit PdxT [Candidatus Thiosymbion oneisti]|uniref:pyridoxal 5'-phosphate synthase glutaminase subunit PdxT n=1 Tax=Candidatus Thiosymbion oneisti TaxID=589554 RepID=UPI000A80EE23|nr:pyridoxal 5'-phosphate synthase glutaminase subunit PdxT [Candidatus Thiosymbion oneisti]
MSGIIGVLALQGGVVEHLAHLAALGLPARRVRQAADFEGLTGLILPGGESTCLSRLLRRYGLDREIAAGLRAGLKLWGTCAGAILLAREVVGETASLGLMDIRVQRNAFGSQLDSFNRTLQVPAVAPEPIPLTFIRAPKILHLGTAVSPLLEIDDYCAAAEDRDILVTVFHPELTPSLAFHRYFAGKCGIPLPPREDAPADWQADSWVDYAPIPCHPRHAAGGAGRGRSAG